MQESWLNTLRSHRDGVALAVGLALPIAVSAALAPFRARFAATAAALVLVAVIVGVASNGSRIAGFMAAASSALWFDFFLTQPYERFAMTHRPDIETAVSLFVVGLAVTELAARRRRHYLSSVEQSDFVVVPTPGQPVSLQLRFVAVALADQVGAALSPHLRSAS